MLTDNRLTVKAQKSLCLTSVNVSHCLCTFICLCSICKSTPRVCVYAQTGRTGLLLLGWKRQIFQYFLFL